MATEIVTQVWCDLCMAEDVKRQATPYPVVLRGIRYEIDLCPEHTAPLDALADTLDEHARTPDGRRKGRPLTRQPSLALVGGSDTVCRVCGGTYDGPTAMLNHARNVHKMNAAEYRGEPSPYVCPECGRAFGLPQGVSLHRVRTHGVKKGQAAVQPTG